jgi:hypothetical protein
VVEQYCTVQYRYVLYLYVEPLTVPYCTIHGTVLVYSSRSIRIPVVKNMPQIIVMEDFEWLVLSHKSGTKECNEN